RSQTGSANLSLGHGSDRLSHRTPVCTLQARRVCRAVVKVTAATVFIRLEPQGVSRPGAFDCGRRSLRKSWPCAQRRGLFISRRSRGRRARSGFPKHRKTLSSPGKSRHADRHGWTGHRYCPVSSVSAGTPGRRREGKKLALLWSATREMRLRLRGGFRRVHEKGNSHPARLRVVA